MSEVVRRESWFLRNTSASRFTVKSEAAAAPINIIRQMRSAARGACRSDRYVTYSEHDSFQPDHAVVQRTV